MKVQWISSHYATTKMHTLFTESLTPCATCFPTPRDTSARTVSSSTGSTPWRTSERTAVSNSAVVFFVSSVLTAYNSYTTPSALAQTH